MQQNGAHTFDPLMSPNEAYGTHDRDPSVSPNEAYGTHVRDPVYLQMNKMVCV